MKTEYLITLGIVVLGVIIGGYVIGKFKLNSYEEYYEGANQFEGDSRNSYRQAA